VTKGKNSLEIDKNSTEKAKEENSDIPEDTEAIPEEETGTEEGNTILVVDKYEIKLIPNNYIVNGRKNPEKGYLFSWDDIPETIMRDLFGYLKKRFDIEWMGNAKIEKTDEGKTIKLSFENNYLSLELSDDKTKVRLKTNDGTTAGFTAKTENGKLNIYIKGWKEFSKSSNTNTYHSTLHGALIQLSNRLLEDKLKEVSKEKPLELKELANLIKEHHKYLEGFARSIVSRWNLPDR